MTRSRRETVTFRHPFRIKGIDRQLPAGAYEVVTDEELIEGLSFPCFRRTATMIMVPGAPPHRQSTEMLSISSGDLASDPSVFGLQSASHCNHKYKRDRACLLLLLPRFRPWPM